MLIRSAKLARGKIKSHACMPNPRPTSIKMRESQANALYAVTPIHPKQRTNNTYTIESLHKARSTATW